MSCPHFKKKTGSPDTSGVCKAVADKTVIPSLNEVTSLCNSESFDECPFYLEYVNSCTKESFCNLISLIEPEEVR